jgi:hypothetical protein
MITRRQLSLGLAVLLTCSGCASENGAESAPGEITEETPLLHEDGTVAAHGWARGPLVQYDRSLVQEEVVDGLREWEYYAVFAPDFAIGLTLADLRVLSFGTLTLEDYATGEIHDAVFLADGEALDFPETPFEDTLFVSDAGSIEYQFGQSGRTITVISGRPGADDRMEAHLQLEDSRETESIAVVHWFDEPGQFFYENKRVSMPATGYVQVGEARYDLPEGQSFGVLDWGRGAWPSEVRWEWGHFAGVTDGHMVGINLGTVFADDTPGTADAVIVDGVLHKISRSEWSYDLEDVMAPWRFTSTDDRIDLTLTPDFDDAATINLGSLYTLTRWKVHGEIRGTVQLDDGSELEVQGVRGAAEYVEILW